MIKNKSRSGWFGASDTATIMGNWNTKSFKKWWCEKLGLLKNGFETKYTRAGTYYEHRIANLIEEVFNTKLKLDRQIRWRKLRLRVNLDSEDKFNIYEIKTFKATENWKVPDNYIMQVRVQMMITGKNGYIVAYPMAEENYHNYFLNMDKEKLIKFKVEKDDEFIKKYLARLNYLSKCLKKGKLPNKEEFENGII